MPRTPIRVPIDDVPRGSLVGEEAQAEGFDVAVHLSEHPPIDEAFDASHGSSSKGESLVPSADSVSADMPHYSIHPMEDSEPPETLAIPTSARVPSMRPPPPASAETDLEAELEEEHESISIPPDEEFSAQVHLAVAAEAYAVDDETDSSVLEEDAEPSEDGDLEEMDATDFVEEAKSSAASRASVPPAMPLLGASPSLRGAQPVGTPAAKPPTAPAAAAGPPPAPPVVQKKWRNWFETFFNEDYLRTVLTPSSKSVARQTDFIERILGLPAGASILDVGCGLGLFANELSRRGYHVVGIDSSKPMIQRATEDAKDYALDVHYITGDMREMAFDTSFDAVLCWGTTFGYFDEETNRRVLARMRDSIREGGKLLLDVVNRDYVVRSQPNLVWFEGDGCVCMEETQFNALTSTLEVSRNVMLDEGRQRETHYAVRLYALHELTRELEQVGFRVQNVSGSMATPGVFFGADASRIIVLAELRGTGSARTPPPTRMSVPPGLI